MSTEETTLAADDPVAMRDSVDADAGIHAAESSDQLHRRSVRRGSEPPSPTVPRKRTNDEVYETIQLPKSSPSSARFHHEADNPKTDSGLYNLGTASHSPDHVNEIDIIRANAENGREVPLGEKKDVGPEIGRILIAEPAIGASLGQAAFPTVTNASSNVANDNSANISNIFSMANNNNSASAMSPFEEALARYQAELEAEYAEFVQDLETREDDAELDAMDWDQLIASYQQEVAAVHAAQEETLKRMEALFQSFLLFQRVTSQEENERAFKRLCTRVTIAEQAEEKLAQKKNHFARVVDAFQTAMRLLTRAT